jgi:hypothetical protein
MVSLRSLAHCRGYEARYDCLYNHRGSSPEHCNTEYLRGITAKIIGRDTASSKWIAIGHMKAVFVRENMAAHKTISHDKPEEFLE